MKDKIQTILAAVIATVAVSVVVVVAYADFADVETEAELQVASDTRYENIFVDAIVDKFKDANKVSNNDCIVADVNSTTNNKDTTYTIKISESVCGIDQEM